jgi:hypothetical protein
VNKGLVTHYSEFTEGPSLCGEQGPSSARLFDDVDCPNCAKVINEDLQLVSERTISYGVAATIRRWVVENPDRVIQAFSIDNDRVILVHRAKQR